MVNLSYIRADEVTTIPRRQGNFGVAVYSLLADQADLPDVVLVVGNARQIMILAEAAAAAGVGTAPAVMGRPTCAAMAEVMRTDRATVSLGCIGNRVYTELSDDELYFVLPGRHANAVAAKLETLVEANRQLEAFHRARLT
jgi:uncharacterized protein (DUF169 family)